jgi:hypothetical protein
MNLIPGTAYCARRYESSAKNVGGVSKLFNEDISIVIVLQC